MTDVVGALIVSRRRVARMAPPLATDPTLDQAVAAMLSALGAYLPAPGGPLPDPTVSVASMTERISGLGNSTGRDARGVLGTVDLKALRVDAVVRFQLWANGPAQADAAVTKLNSEIARDIDKLRTGGFLRITLDAAPPPDLITGLSAWRKHADYKALFEFAYESTDGAAALIAKIPIAIDSTLDEKTTVTDRMVRWDNEHADPLVVRGPANIAAMDVLVFVAVAAPTGKVSVQRTFDGAPAPAAAATLVDFVAAAGGPNPVDRNVRLLFNTYNDFLNACLSAGSQMSMGDWNNDNVDDVYQPKVMPFSQSIELAHGAERFEVAYENPPFDKVGVLYLRAR